MEIQLTVSEIMQGALVGIMRVVVCIKNKLKDKAGEDGYSWERHIEGALAEMALAKHLQMYWGGRGSITSSDVGDFEVRNTANHGYKLIMHPDPRNPRHVPLRDGKGDSYESTFWLVTGKMGFYIIQGLISGQDGQRDEFWSEREGGRRSAYFIPQSALTKPQSLLDQGEEA